jgi:hypothetical protein
MMRVREVAGGGRAVEVEAGLLAGWIDRFAARHGGLAATTTAPDALVVTAADGATACVAVPFGGLPPGAAGVVGLVAHLTAPRRIGLVLVRLGGFSVGVAEGGAVLASSTGTRPVHGRNRKGGSSANRYRRRRDNQARVALDAAADTVARMLLGERLDALVLGGDATALDELRADRRLTALFARAEPRVLDVPEPRRAVLDEAARRALAVEVVVREHS